MIKITGLEHISVAAEGVEPTASILKLFGIVETGSEEIPTQQVVTTYYGEPRSGVQFEIIRPSTETSNLKKFLKERGPGVHHICFQVNNLEEACDEVKKAGGTIYGEIFSDSRGRHAFVHPRSTGGVLIGMIELHPEFRSND